MKNAINTECEEHSYKEAEKQRIEEFREAAGHVFSANMIKEMKDMGFFLCPASLGHHGDHIGGLYDHSMAVLRALEQLTTCLDLSWQRKKSPILIAVFHDWAKLQDYIQIGTGREIQYIHNTHKTLHGHGNISVIMALQFLQNHISAPKLTQEEIACIRYHMGAFAKDRDEWGWYTDAIKTFPNVLWTHTADMMASQITGV